MALERDRIGTARRGCPLHRAYRFLERIAAAPSELDGIWRWRATVLSPTQCDSPTPCPDSCYRSFAYTSLRYPHTSHSRISEPTRGWVISPPHCGQWFILDTPRTAYDCLDDICPSLFGPADSVAAVSRIGMEIPPSRLRRSDSASIAAATTLGGSVIELNTRYKQSLTTGCTARTRHRPSTRGLSGPERHRPKRPPMSLLLGGFGKRNRSRRYTCYWSPSGPRQYRRYPWQCRQLPVRPKTTPRGL